MVSEAELEAIVAKRVKERAEIISDALAALKPELDNMSDQIAAANHVKEELKGELEELNAAVTLSQRRMEEHARLTWHPAAQQLMADFNIAALSLEEKKALPEVLEEHVSQQRNRVKAERRQVWIHLATSFLSAVVTAVVILTSFLAWLAAHGGIRIGQ